MNQLDFKGRTAVVTGGMHGHRRRHRQAAGGIGCQGRCLGSRWISEGRRCRLGLHSGGAEPFVREPQKDRRARQQCGHCGAQYAGRRLPGRRLAASRRHRPGVVGRWCCAGLRAHGDAQVGSRKYSGSSTSPRSRARWPPIAAAYAAAKGGLIAFRKASGQELPRAACALVNCVTPARGADRDSAPGQSGFEQYMLCEDPDGALRERWRRSRRSVCWLVVGGLLVLHRGRIRYFRRQGHLLRRRSTMKRRRR